MESSGRASFFVVAAACVMAGCSSDPDTATEAPAVQPASVETPPAAPRRPPPTRSGSALVRTPAGDALILADEDHDAIRRIPLPVDVQTPPSVTALPGDPANVLALHDKVLVTLRDPGALVVLRTDGDALVEAARVALPADAWGLAVTADEKTALVTSAWSHRVSAVDLDSMQVRWTVNVGREPRGIAVTGQGVAYVSHLVGRWITRIDGIDGTPSASWVDLPPAPLKARRGEVLAASLGYSAVLSPDGDRLFVPRLAIGAQGESWWFGASTVDVLLTNDDAPLALPRNKKMIKTDPFAWDDALMQAVRDVDDAIPLGEPGFVQPRAAIYRPSTRTLLVASEGDDRLAEVDARAIDPALKPLRTYKIGQYDSSLPEYHPSPRVVQTGGAPSAIALSEDDSTAYVFCRSTYDLAIVRLDAYDKERPFEWGPIPVVHLADDTLSPDAAKGRRLYYNATDFVVSGGLACSGCHPEGRDDGHVWHELGEGTDEAHAGYRGSPVVPGKGDASLGHPRQTPMLAGRVNYRGPYGWHGKSATLEDRLRVGFSLHRWGGSSETGFQVAMERPKLIAAFAREGLVPPATEKRELDARELRGKAVFEDSRSQCTTCHEPRHGYTDRSVVALNRGKARGFDAEEDRAFKTPSLLYVGGTAPYYHDGQAQTLEELVATNGKSMGNTSYLFQSDRDALVAYLRTLGGISDAAVEPPRTARPKNDVPASFAPVPDAAPLDARPSRDSWATAPRVVSPRSDARCSVQRQGAWVHLSCEDWVATSMDQLAGDKRGVEVYKTDPVAHAVFPLRRGDRSVWQATVIEPAFRWGMTVSAAAILEVVWPSDAAEPTFVLR